MIALAQAIEIQNLIVWKINPSGEVSDLLATLRGLGRPGMMELMVQLPLVALPEIAEQYVADYIGSHRLTRTVNIDHPSSGETLEVVRPMPTHEVFGLIQTTNARRGNLAAIYGSEAAVFSSGYCGFKWHPYSYVRAASDPPVNLTASDWIKGFPFRTLARIDAVVGHQFLADAKASVDFWDGDSRIADVILPLTLTIQKLQTYKGTYDDQGE